MNCSCGHIFHVSKIQVYLYKDVFQLERVFHHDRSQWLSYINSVHLHWDLHKKKTNVEINNSLLLTHRVGNKTLKGIAILKLFETGKCRRTSRVELLKRDR